MKSLKEKIEEWFIEDVKKQIEWSCEEVSNKRIQKIAKDKSSDLIEKCLKEYVNE